MAGTLPHAVFVETDIDEAGTAVAFAGELPGCAAFDVDAAAAVAAVPARVGSFVAWLRAHGESITEPVGNWYEVERAAAIGVGDGRRRAAFSLDELPPSQAELETWLRWAEHAREDLAAALDANPEAAAAASWLADQDLELATALGGAGTVDESDALGRLYAARDALMDALATPGRDGARRALRLAIADDLRLAGQIRAE